MPLGVPELLIVLVIVLLIFGAKRVPLLGRQLGGGLKEFKKSVRDGDEDATDGDAEPERPELPAGERPASGDVASRAGDEQGERPGA